MSKKDKWPFWPEKKKLSGDELAEHLKKIDRYSYLAAESLHFRGQKSLFFISKFEKCLLLGLKIIESL